MTRRTGFLWGCLILGSALLFLNGTSPRLGSDDVHWLRGAVATPYDAYRLLPRLFFALLYDLSGSVNRVAAYAMVFGFHLLNTALVYILAVQILRNRRAADVAAAVFCINPLALGTLTWIACFSYVIGLTCGLVALICGIRYLRSHSGAPLHVPTKWGLATLMAYTMGLFASHVVLFLPAAFLVLAWLDEGGSTIPVALGVPTKNQDFVGARHVSPVNRTRAQLLILSGFLIGFVVYLSVYALTSPTNTQLTPDFISAYVSSTAMLLPALTLTYPVSFAGDALGLLMMLFQEPVRWMVALGVVAGLLQVRLDRREGRLWWALVALFVVLITPYILRLYWLSGYFNYHPSYMLMGRVFYIPFVVVALVMGRLIAPLLSIHRWAMAVFIAAFNGLVFAGLLTGGNRYQGLTVIQGAPGEVPPPWTPFVQEHSLWLGVLVLVVAMGLLARQRIPARLLPGLE